MKGENINQVIPLPDIELTVPEKSNIAWEACDKRVEEGKGNNVFLYFKDREVTYKDMQVLMNRIGNALLNAGITRGDSVMFRAINSVEYLASILAALKIGAIAVPSQTLFKEREVEYVVNSSDSLIAFADPDLVGTIDAVRDQCPTLKRIITYGESSHDHISFENFIKDASDYLECADTYSSDTSYILYTSGTSGMPKGVIRTHRDTYSSGIPTSRQAALTSDDVFLHPFEFSFGFIYATFAAVNYAGCKMVLYSGRTTVDGVLEAVQKYKVTKLSAVPSLYRMILGISDVDKKYDLSSLRGFTSGGEVLPPDTYKAIKQRFGLECMDGIGQTECNFIIGNRYTISVKPGSMGKPYPGINVAIIDEDGNFCSANTIGHLAVKDDCPILFKGYMKLPEKWDEVHRFPGWYDSGDLAYYDDDGYYYWIGRADAMIKSRGYLVSPYEVEETILEIPEVLEAASVGSPDPVIGNRIKVFVTLKDGFKPSENLALKIRDYISGRIAPYKVPKDIEFAIKLPKTLTGKISRRELRKLEEERYSKGEIAGHRFK
jgi:acyl-coenzyme A synthetase/AMP-(fatty) acid ligase